MVDEFLEMEPVAPARFAEVTALPVGLRENALDPYAERLLSFRSEGLGRLRA